MLQQWDEAPPVPREVQDKLFEWEGVHTFHYLCKASVFSRLLLPFWMFLLHLVMLMDLQISGGTALFQQGFENIL